MLGPGMDEQVVPGTIRLMLLSKGDYFGLDEVFKGQPIRNQSVTCTSMKGSCIYLP